MDFDKKSKPMSDMISREKGMVSPTDGGTIPVNFTFVPSIGMLPSEVLLAKESNYHPKVVGPKGILLQKGILKQTECGAFEELVENDIPENVPEKLLQEKMYESPQTILKTVHKAASKDRFLQKQFASNDLEDIKHNDLFIAEFVVLMDSDDEEDVKIAKTSQSLSFEETKYGFGEKLKQSTAQHPRETVEDIKVKETYIPRSQKDCCNVGNLELQLYKIKSSYKSFAAIPTNTLLLDQKAIDEPETNARNSNVEDEADTHSEMCSPALLRQQTEEICAAIDEVLHDPFPLHSNSTTRPPNLKPEKRLTHLSRPPMKSAGRETKYASLQPDMKAKATDSQTRPGVIRPMTTHENKDKKMYPNLYQQFSMPPYKKE
ncbi:muscular LMNA-interacting protein isoform X12 [Engystomops pustulosus]|uniref:muscular LMNA-interacting protein isoform X12 n=1 Tax=Engystomops pustulosus TaxID=76066 RepID=UPI003AFAD4CB